MQFHLAFNTAEQLILPHLRHITRSRSACYTRRSIDVELANHHAALPGGLAKWVKIPRGAATVSGELHSAAGMDRQPLCTRMGRHGMSRIVRPSRTR